MKKWFFVLLLPVAFASYGQNPYNMDSLAKQFSFIFIDTDTADNYHEALYVTTRYVLSPNNVVFYDVLNDLSKKTPASHPDTLLFRITDSMFRRFYAEGFWGKDMAIKTKHSNLLFTYNTFLCNCATSKTVGENNPDKIIQVIRECDAAAARNSEFMAVFSPLVQAVPSANRAAVLGAMKKYLYQYCSVYNKAVNSLFFEAVKDNYYSYLFTLRDNLTEKVISLYQRQNNDSLSTLFPSHASYKDDLKKSLDMFPPGKYDFVTASENKDGNRSDTTTYFKTNGNKVDITGQHIINYTINNLELVVNSFRHIVPGKITNKSLWLSRINEVDEPPPPQEPIKRGQ
jgi:hypothetical protein